MRSFSTSRKSPRRLRIPVAVSTSAAYLMPAAGTTSSSDAFNAPLNTGESEARAGTAFLLAYAPLNTTNGSSDDAVARKIRNRSDADGYYRPAYATTPSGDDDVPQYVSLGMSKPQAVKAGSVVDAKFDVEYGDAGDAHANGNYPGILSGAAKKTSFVATTEVPAGAVWRFVEVDPKNGYKVTKTYPTRTGPFTETGKVEPGKHLYVELHPTADGTVNVAVKVQYWDL